ncbi:hypothetical protein SPRG_02036 [Saprolegnia parasitica CBS 223.65]|uniref:Uncharacterized protein n=1 Tax=Saprolegnia parasitica (strain CBS 223.65) TaxID=695850 RepID=A0A067D3D9_SAPPC|nr:hypothetical protein SPRG_02036 [Saprolegnia parasitica CBS 223.65]KDO33226.1 hypothetical protein SPRG_02036 [Saprolegnia parasitica CBS 223.65]|eukprot:XP_012195983.1 hypothetical protein SPRG_02036 [Saprolegnia parasitica CBS 223.65]
MIQRLQLGTDRRHLSKLMSDDSSESERSARVAPRDLASPDFDRILGRKSSAGLDAKATTDAKGVVDGTTVVTVVASNEYEDVPHDVYVAEPKSPARSIGNSIHSFIFGIKNGNNPTKRSAPPPSPPTQLRHEAKGRNNAPLVVRKPVKSWDEPNPSMAPADEETTIEAFS